MSGPSSPWEPWATWNVIFWFDASDTHRNLKERFVNKTADLTAAKVEAFVRDVFPYGTPDMKEGRAPLAYADYEKVCSMWIKEK